MAKLAEQAARARGYDIVTVWANADQEKQIKDVEDSHSTQGGYHYYGPGAAGRQHGRY